jgi:hypothetical protein
MTTGLENRLRADMEEFTRDLRVPPGLALRAYRHARKRRTVHRVAIASGTAAVLTATAVAGVSGAFGSATETPAETTAYVVTQVDRALEPANIANLIGFSRTVFADANNLEPLGGGLYRPTASPGWSVATILQWGYRNTAKSAAYGPDGRHVYDMKWSYGSDSATQTTVLFNNSTWWIINSGIRLGGEEGPARIRQLLRQGAYQVAGHQVVDRVDALKLVGGDVTMWLDPATYLPVEISIPGMRTYYQWLAPTPANLALLKEPIPAGFRQVPAPRA